MKESQVSGYKVESLREVHLGEIMEQAYDRHIVVPAFNVPYLPMIKPIVDTLKVLDCFGLIEVARPDIAKFEAKSFKAVAEELNKYADKGYTRLHQDHIPVIDEDGQRVDWQGLIQQALDLDFDSVMIDGSRLSLEENIEITRTVVKIAQAKSVLVEAELGAVLGHEKGPLPAYEGLFNSGKGFTDPGEARRFVKETGIDWLSIAIGNIHGAISGVAKDEKKVEARINIEHLREISALTRRPLVLHGGSGIRQESVLAAIQNGITKINVGTVLRQVYEKELKERGDIRFAQEAISREIESIIKSYYHIQGSATRLVAAILKTN
jgi:ketose-bisphosphate aldolase